MSCTASSLPLNCLDTAIGKLKEYIIRKKVNMIQTDSYEVVVKNSAQSVIVPLKGGIYALDRVYKALVAANVNPYTGYCSNYDYIRQQIVQACQSLQHSDRAATTCLRRLDLTLETLTLNEGKLERQKNATHCTLANLRTKQESKEKLLQESQRALGQAERHVSSARATLRRQEIRKENAAVAAGVGLGLCIVPVIGWVAGPVLVLSSIKEDSAASDAIDIAENELRNSKCQVDHYKHKVSDHKCKIDQTRLNISTMDEKMRQIHHSIQAVKKQRCSVTELQRKLRSAVHALGVLSGRVNVLEQHTRQSILQESVMQVMGEVMMVAEEITRNELLCNAEMLSLVCKMRRSDRHLRAICASQSHASNNSFLANYI